MANYRLSKKAEEETDRLYAYSIEQFGLETARKYLAGLYQRFELLADNPDWGVDYGHIEPGLRRYEHRSHSIYYLPADDSIFIVRILGARQDPERHL